MGNLPLEVSYDKQAYWTPKNLVQGASLSR